MFIFENRCDPTDLELCFQFNVRIPRVYRNAPLTALTCVRTRYKRKMTDTGRSRTTWSQTRDSQLDPKEVRVVSVCISRGNHI